MLGTRLRRIQRSKMAGFVRKSVDWFKLAWAREPVVFMSCVFGISGNLIVIYYLVQFKLVDNCVKTGLNGVQLTELHVYCIFAKLHVNDWLRPVLTYYISGI